MPFPIRHLCFALELCWGASVQNEMRAAEDQYERAKGKIADLEKQLQVGSKTRAPRVILYATTCS